MLRVMLVDDEALARQGLRQMLEKIPDLEICAEAENLRQAVAAVPAVRPDALFLDVEMPNGGGFELLARLKPPPPVVFVTAHSEYAARAFDVDAVDYLLKPVRAERLTVAVERLRAALANLPESPALGETDRICLRTPGRTLVAPLDKLLLLQADGDFTRATVEGEAPLMICQSVGNYERTLPSPPFARLDRSILLNLSRVVCLRNDSSRGVLVLLRGLDEPIPLGRTAAGRLREALPQIAIGL